MKLVLNYLGQISNLHCPNLCFEFEFGTGDHNLKQSNLLAMKQLDQPSQSSYFDYQQVYHIRYI